MTSTTFDSSATSSVRDYWSLLKPGVMSLVVFTGLAGLLVAPGHIHPLLGVMAILCIALGSGAGGAINMWFDRDIDAVMLRTAARPLPSGRIAAEDALAFGIILGVASVSLMGLAVGWLAAFLLAFAIGFYVFVYTVWLKRRTPQNIVIGGAAGAFPPMIGWAAVTGDVTLMPMLLFLIIFFWTPPHFWALALYRNQDYRRAGVPMLPVTHGSAVTTLQMVSYTIALWLLTLLPWALGLAGWIYGMSAFLLGGRFMQHALRVRKDPSEIPARAMFKFSILYLFALFLSLLADKWLL